MDSQLTRKIRVALVGRVSTEEQKKGENINSQMAELQKFAVDNNYEIIKEYLDDGWSGGLLNRPGLDAMRDDAGKGLFDAVIFNDVDRLARDVVNIGIVQRDLEKKGVRLMFRKLPNNEDNPMMKDLMVNVLGSFAQFEKALIADRTRRGRRYKAEVRKQIVGGIPPYGFDYVPKDKKLGIEGIYKRNEEEIIVAQKMFELVDTQGLTGHGLVKWLTDNETPSRKKRGKWSKSSVLSILHRTEYIGVAYYNKHLAVEPTNPISQNRYKKQIKSSRRLRPRSEWIPIPVPECKIISQERFDRVQEILKSNKVFSKRNTKDNYLLAKLFYCECGALFYGCPMHGKLFYRCSNKHKTFPNPRTCNFGSIKSTHIDETVWSGLVELITNPKLIAAKIDEYEKYRDKNSKHSQIADKDYYSKLLKNIEAEDERLLKAYKTGILSFEKFERETSGLNVKKQECLGHLNELSLEGETDLPVRVIEDRAEKLREELSSGLNMMNDNFEARQRITRILVEKATISGDLIDLDCKLSEALAPLCSTASIIC